MDEAQGRKFLDDQLAKLNELGIAASAAYLGVAALPYFVRNTGQDAAFEVLHRLVARMPTLENLLDSAEHWLGPTDSVYVPVPAAEGERRSACSGAMDLLQALRVMAEFADDDRSWLSSAPSASLEALADVARHECDNAISRLTAKFFDASGEADNRKNTPSANTMTFTAKKLQEMLGVSKDARISYLTAAGVPKREPGKKTPYTLAEVVKVLKWAVSNAARDSERNQSKSSLDELGNVDPKST